VNYIYWNLVLSLAPYLDHRFTDALEVLFYLMVLESKLLEKSIIVKYFSIQNLLPQPYRYALCINTIDNQMGLALGSWYSRKYANPNQKTAASKLVDQLKSTLKKMVQINNWMDDVTKTMALEKVYGFIFLMFHALNLKFQLDSLISHISYPEIVFDDSAIDKFYKNVRHNIHFTTIPVIG